MGRERERRNARTRCTSTPEGSNSGFAARLEEEEESSSGEARWP